MYFYIHNLYCTNAQAQGGTENEFGWWGRGHIFRQTI